MDGFPERAIALKKRFQVVRETSFDVVRESAGGPAAAQRGGEFLVLLEYYMALRPMRVLEIGTYHGGTLWYWTKYAPPGAKIWTVDLDHEQCREWDNIKALRKDVEVTRVTGRSDGEYVHGYDFGPLDFVFIDGCHHFPTVRTDWEWYGRKAKACAFHDIACGPDPKHPQDIRVLWNEIVEKHPNTVSFIEKEPDALCYGIGIVEP